MIAPTAENTQLQKAEAGRYATYLDWGTRLGLLVLIASFAAYMLGLTTPLVSLQDLPQLWNQPVAVFQQKTGTPMGWGWLSMLGKGDMLNLLGIAILAGCSIPPLLSLIPLYLKRHDYTYVGICLVIALVLVLAASGILTGGH
ncbi:MAG: hypothetical protein IPN53_18920 [Comamonadaceae bacterium]|nr:hypothetical protein [Comamonadaceae bacterium]